MIPKIIHQIWEGKTEPLPEFLSQLSETWKENHPHWHYEFWDGDRMERFVQAHFPDFSTTYYTYHYPVQRWDAVRYLILYKMGGMYVDFDNECIKPIDNCIEENGTCYFSMEPDEHYKAFGKEICFNNALMIAPAGHPFFDCIIRHLQSASFVYTGNKMYDVLHSTGPLMLTNLYEKFEHKAMIDFFRAEQVSPWSKNEVQRFIDRTADMEQLGAKLEKAIAIHYFFGSWLSTPVS